MPPRFYSVPPPPGKPSIFTEFYVIEEENDAEDEHDGTEFEEYEQATPQDAAGGSTSGFHPDGLGAA